MTADDFRVFCYCGNEMSLEELDNPKNKKWYCDECFICIKITDNRLKVIN